MSSANGRPWPPLPAFNAAIMSQDVYANPTTTLTVIGGGGGGGGTPPGNVPVPVPGAITSTSIEISFDVAGVTGTQPITYDAAFAVTSGGPYEAISLSPPVGTVYTGSIGGLTPNTPYYFIVQALNSAGQTTSTEVQINTSAAGPTPPGNLPNVQLALANSTFLNLFIDTAAVTGTTPITYSTRYASTEGAWNTSVGFALSSGTIYSASAQDLYPGTNYYFQTLALNTGGTTSSMQPYAILSTLASTIEGPNVAPSIPTAGLISPSSMNITTNISSVTGSPTPSYYILFGPTDPPTQGYSTTSTGPDTRTAYISSLTANTPYYARSQAYISSTNVSTSASAVFSTLVAPTAPSAPTKPELVSASPSSITVSFDASAVTGTTPISYLGFWSTINNPVGTAFSVFPSSLTSTQVGTVDGLQDGGVYYFTSQAINAYGSTTSGASLLSTVNTNKLANLPVPLFSTATQSSISFSFDVSSVTGNMNTIFYSAGYGSTFGTTDIIVSTLTSTGTLYSGTATGLLASRNYYFQSIGNNQYGQAVSPYASSFSTLAGPSPPSGTPTVPQPFASNLSSLMSTFYMDTAGITGGTGPLTFQFSYYVLGNAPFSTVQATVSTGTIYSAALPNLDAQPTYVASQAVTPAGSTTSGRILFNPFDAASIPTAYPISTISSIVVASTSISVVSFPAISPGDSGNPQATPCAAYNQLGTTGKTIIPLTEGALSPSFSGTASSLQSGTSYVFANGLQNTFGSALNPSTAVFSTLGLPLTPGTPFVLGGVDNSVTVGFDALSTVTTGGPYLLNISYDAGVTFQSTITATLSTGTVFSATLTPENGFSTTLSYVAQAQVSTQRSATSGSFQVYDYGTPAGPLVNVVGGANAITVVSNPSDGYPGYPGPVAFRPTCGLTSTTSTEILGDTYVQGPLWTALINGLSSGTVYYVNSAAINGVGVNPFYSTFAIAVSTFP